jgi:hypothetical protein
MAQCRDYRLMPEIEQKIAWILIPRCAFEQRIIVPNRLLPEVIIR